MYLCAAPFSTLYHDTTFRFLGIAFYYFSRVCFRSVKIVRFPITPCVCLRCSHEAFEALIYHLVWDIIHNLFTTAKQALERGGT